MGLFSILGKGLRSMVTEALTPESFRIGQKFEDYSREWIFPLGQYDLIERTHSYETNNRDYVLSSLKPDFKFRDCETGRLFYLETKYRKAAYKGKIMWCDQNQLE